MIFSGINQTGNLNVLIMMNAQWSALTVILVLQNFINLATWYYISGYTPGTQKTSKVVNMVLNLIILISELYYCLMTLCYFLCKGKHIKSNKNIFPQ